jgi:hypothetical protein
MKINGDAKAEEQKEITLEAQAWLDVIAYLKSMQQLGTAMRVEEEMKRRGIE